MGLLEKMGLVEREEIPTEVPEQAIEPALDQSVEANIQSAESIVDSVYEQNGISDKTSSIYTVRDLIATLPQEMTTQRMQQSIAGILKVSGKPVAELMADAEMRINVLSAAREKIIAENEATISAAQADIENLKSLIESATLKIREAEQIIDAAKKEIDDERDGIDQLISFCKGMEETT